jgi:dihydroorotate dehydrogenase (fumarate)
MTDLSTKYLGLDLKNPLIVGSSGLTDSVDGVVACEKAGAGAVVLKSIFEEQIVADVAHLADASEASYWHTEAADYISQYGRHNEVDRYIRLIRESKQAASIPVIASIHCVSPGVWTEFASRVEEAGADALELNVFIFPADPLRRGARATEQAYLDIVAAVKRNTTLPVSVKMSRSFSSLPEMALKLQSAGADGLVLFNRFYQFNIDIETGDVVPGEFLSSPSEIAFPLRWISVLSGLVDCDLAATTGVHDGAGVVKLLLVGADAVQVCSALYKNGVDHLTGMIGEVEAWMSRHGHEKVSDFRGAMSRVRSSNPAAHERVQFMKLSTGERSAR